MQLVAYGYVINFDIRHVPSAVLDEDRTRRPRAPPAIPVHRLVDVKYYLHNQKAVRDLIDRSQITMAVWVQGFSPKKLRQGQSGTIQVIVDATDSNAALIVAEYAPVIERLLPELLQARLPAPGGVLDREVWTRPWGWSPGPGSTPT